MALLIGIAVMKTNAGTIKKPPPTPKNPVSVPTTAPLINNATIHLEPILLQTDFCELDIIFAFSKLQAPIKIISIEKLSINSLSDKSCEI
ncbi:hypothetical protein DR79_1278 [Francisella tularensis]|nr:hypothetical protein DR79_1278 [Francisella tularensis]